ncbi:hypothetical protein [Nocardia sp. alder85J]|uniref:hypothetical protein n=1 Tax=Nocardia sp. alder85J TaxID=2862949 RepID=UPI001CD4B51E|nr:hypothetical protein [Nocardia sp. alder85J]MCX4092870.1 hypothetical protein [Nocardia sp. alder85J]
MPEPRALVVTTALLVVRVPHAARPAPGEQPMVPLPAVTSLLPVPPQPGFPAREAPRW